MFSYKKTVKGINPNKPFIVLNFKTYKESSGDDAVRLAKIAEKVQVKSGLNIIICPQAIDLKQVAAAVSIPVYAQHTDSLESGKSTGGIIAENIIDIGIFGSLLNHSEKRVDIKILSQTVLKLKELNIKSVVCVLDDKEAKKMSMMQPVKPDFISVEPPELIGGELSVSSAKPDIIKKAVASCNNIPVIVGAGIKDNNDLKVALSLGAKGVLLASHYVKAADPEKFLLELIAGIY